MDRRSSALANGKPGNLSEPVGGCVLLGWLKLLDTTQALTVVRSRN